MSQRQADVEKLNEMFSSTDPNYTESEKRKGFTLINPKDVTFEKFLGDGASADVFLGKWEKADHESKLVAVKILKKKVSKKMLADFRKELKVMKEVRGDLVVVFFGITIRPRFTVIMEFCQRGSLHDVLNNKDWDCTWQKFFDICRQCIQAVMTLHDREKQIVHRDLKSMNFLVTEDWTVKVCDFGLSRQTIEGNFGNGSMINTLSTLKSCRGTYCYTAPEVFNKMVYTPKADVFSLSIIIWEVLMRCLYGEYKRPYSSYPQYKMDFQILIAVGNKKIRPALPDEVPKRIKTLLQGAWEDDPKERKDVNFCFSYLNFALSEYRNGKDAWDGLRKAS